VIVADTNNHRLNFYNPAPTATGATPNFFIGKVVAGFNGRNAMAADKTNFLAPYGMLLKGTQMFVADTGNHRVLVWNGIPTTNDTAPNFAIGQQDVDTVTFPSGSSAQNTLNSPRGLCASSNKLFVTESGNHRVSIYNLPITGNQPNAIAVLGQPTYLDNSSCAATSKGCFNQAWGCFYDEVSDELFVTDRNNHRIIYWQNFMTNFEAGPDPMDGGASDAKQFLGTWVFGSNDATSACSATKLNTPIGVWADATNLWIADTGNKRVVGFNRNITSDTPTQLITLGETTNSSCGGGTTQALLSNSIGVISVSGKIYTANSNSRRVVMWDNPTADGEPMTSVMGQINFTNSNYGESGSQVPMSNPEFLYTDGKRIFQSDSVTNKISIYPLFN
jgi:hypothetical protein